MRRLGDFMKKIALLGCTGSIGSQVISVIERYPEKFKIVSLSANDNAKKLEELINKFKPKTAVLTNAEKLSEIKEVPKETTLYYGQNALLHAVSEEADVIFVAVSGYAGYKVVKHALTLNKTVALANKESLVAGGEIISKIKTGKIIPVDSEHSAIWQCLDFNKEREFKKLIITASGGAFRTLSKAEIATLPAEKALNHPTWKMGKKITIDCATMMNKGFEVIEAKWLFNCPLEKIQVVVHPQSVVHSMVSFSDGVTMAQTSYPSMEIPIQLALTYPERLPTSVEDFDFYGKSLTFEKVNFEKFPCFNLALNAQKQGGNAPCALNGANERAVSKYLNGEIGFYGISDSIEYVLSKISKTDDLSDYVLDKTDKDARNLVDEYFRNK
ncbi:MAG TPA: 1-deoxy-D-xylulose-5-phosphate reductoisomerase [Clostridiales bacterium]|nr:1-deoxy-D-xylulose-5-phosphate reductoisomerase [Clostridiales bacterium]